MYVYKSGHKRVEITPVRSVLFDVLTHVHVYQSMVSRARLVLFAFLLMYMYTSVWLSGPGP